MLATRILLGIFLTFFLSFMGFAQGGGSAVSSEMRQKANEFYQQKDWRNSADAYEKIVNLEEANANAHYRYGVSLLGLGKNKEAQAQLEKAFEASLNSIFAYHLARAFARLGDKEKLYEVLDKSTTLGGISPETLNGEADFVNLKDEQRFKDLIRKSDIAINPCKASEEFRRFDFWIGEWEAKDTSGNLAGTSSVQLILGQCIIFENWTGTSGVSGKSFNIYDVNDKKWHQTWVDDKGTFTHYIGGWEDGKMIITADSIVNNKKALSRMTFSKLPNGDVRQHGEDSIDSGKTWTTTFDLKYSRKKP